MEFMERVLDSALYAKLPFRLKKKVTNLLAFGFTAKTTVKEFISMIWAKDGDKILAYAQSKLTDMFESE